MSPVDVPTAEGGWRVLLPWLGRLVSFAALGWIVILLVEHWDTLEPLNFDISDWALLVLLALAYAFLGFLLSAAWQANLRAQAEIDCSSKNLHRLFAVTQLAKYLPGNVFHYVGRQLSGRAIGIQHGVLAMASITEAASLILSAGLCVMVWMTWVGFALDGDLRVIVWVSLLLAVLILVASAKHRWVPGSRLRLSFLLVGLVGHTVFFLATAVIFWLLVLLADASVDFLLALGCFSLAWLLGFVVPGSPGGLGVREAALVWLLAPALSIPIATMLALLMRGVTLTGDLLLFGMGHLIGYSNEP